MNVIKARVAILRRDEIFQIAVLILPVGTVAYTHIIEFKNCTDEIIYKAELFGVSKSTGSPVCKELE